MPIDCEALHDGWFAQPVNTITALGFLVAGGLVWRRSKVLAIALGILAAGSFSFHTDQNSWTGWLDAWGVLLVLGAIIEHRLDRPGPRAVWLGGIAVSALMVIPQGLRGPATVLVGIVATGWVIRTVTVRWLAAIAGVGGLGLLIYVLGRNGGPLCEPDSLLQPHAVWHLLAALAIVLVAHAPVRST